MLERDEEKEVRGSASTATWQVANGTKGFFPSLGLALPPFSHSSLPLAVSPSPSPSKTCHLRTHVPALCPFIPYLPNPCAARPFSGRLSVSPVRAAMAALFGPRPHVKLLRPFFIQFNSMSITVSPSPFASRASIYRFSPVFDSYSHVIYDKLRFLLNLPNNPHRADSVRAGDSHDYIECVVGKPAGVTSSAVLGRRYSTSNTSEKHDS
jgi:hypothetical protein